MKTVRQRKRPIRTVRLVVPPNEHGLNGVIKIKQDSEEYDYHVDHLTVDFGRGFVVERVDQNSPEHRYEVVIDGPRSSCTCKGKKFMGRCKHEGALAQLVKLGKI